MMNEVLIPLLAKLENLLLAEIPPAVKNSNFKERTYCYDVPFDDEAVTSLCRELYPICFGRLCRLSRGLVPRHKRLRAHALHSRREALFVAFTQAIRVN